jgi:hypothetical protein
MYVMVEVDEQTFFWSLLPEQASGTNDTKTFPHQRFPLHMRRVCDWRKIKKPFPRGKGFPVGPSAIGK